MAITQQIGRLLAEILDAQPYAAVSVGQGRRGPSVLCATDTGVVVIGPSPTELVAVAARPGVLPDPAPAFDLAGRPTFLPVLEVAA